MSIENFLYLQIEPDKSTPEFPRVLFVELGLQLGDLDWRVISGLLNNTTSNLFRYLLPHGTSCS